MTLEVGEALGHNPKVNRRSVENTFSTPFYKKDSVKDVYNTVLTARLYPGGGWTASIYPADE